MTGEAEVNLSLTFSKHKKLRLLKLKHKKRYKCLVCSASPAVIYLLKVNNRNTGRKCEICSKITIKTTERRHWRRTYFTSSSTVSTVNFEHVNTGWVITKRYSKKYLGTPSLVVCGDSIIAGLRRYSSAWRIFFPPLRVINLGIIGD